MNNIFRLMAIMFVVVPLYFLASGCEQKGSGDEQINKKVMELEGKVDVLQNSLDDQRLKSMIISSQVFKSPLEQFFQSAEFWENTYDSGQADCSRRCIRDLQAMREQCMQKPVEAERLACFQEASDRAVNCHRQCAGL